MQMSILNIKTTVATISVGVFLAFAGTAGAATMSCTTTGSGNSAATLSLTDAVDAACFKGNDTNSIDLTTSIFGLTGWILAYKNDDGSSGDQSITFTSGVIIDAESGSWALSSLESDSIWNE